MHKYICSPNPGMSNHYTVYLSLNRLPSYPSKVESSGVLGVKIYGLLES